VRSRGPAGAAPADDARSADHRLARSINIRMIASAGACLRSERIHCAHQIDDDRYRLMQYLAG
jgi:hypothetical protein